MSVNLQAAPRTLDAPACRTSLGLMLSDTATLIDDLTAEVESLRPLIARDPVAETDYLWASRRLAVARQTAVEANAALQRMDDGSYGRCVKCSEQIPFARLELRPHADCCVTCS
ncbi:MAG: TraR/DksA C4-type zinc finger protein [Candidatus Nanopelagicales bacterium]